MSQILSQLPRQMLSQQQRLTPQLIQAMDILQLPAMELESRLDAELDANPALELVPAEEETDAPPPETAPDAAEPANEFEQLETLVREYDFDEDFGFRPSKSRAQLEDEGEQKLDAMANAAARPINLQEHLLSQWNLRDDLDQRVRALGTRIIESLADSGRLEAPLNAIGAAVQPAATPNEVESVLFRVQQLDPPGIAARSLQEALVLQLEALPGDHEIPIRIVEEHFDDLQRNRLPQIAKALEISVDEVKEAIHVLSRLSLQPGLDVVERQTPVVMPDVIVEFNEQAGEYEVRLARSNLRELRIAPEFREMLEKSRSDKQTREFVKDKILRANAIIDAIRFRRERLLEVAKAVVEAQRDFLDYGEQHIRALRMSDLAARFGCDPSTISRTVDEKWLQTPRGIYPLRRFFTGGTESESGEILGWDSIKAKVQEIVAAEDKQHPLNDDEIVDQLRQAGIDIKRRTVAKYRSQLNIPTARQRRQY